MKRSKVYELVFERFEIVQKEGWYILKDRKYGTYLESDKGTIAFKTEEDATKFLASFFIKKV